MNTTYRYPGVKPFEAIDAALFFGRDRELIDLQDFIKREQLVVLFGKSGYGKSSLIKAGLIPDLLGSANVAVNAKTGEDESLANCPVYIRLNQYNKASKALMPYDTVAACLREQESETHAELVHFFQQKALAGTLWTAFKSSKITAGRQIFLVFDQFEEFFSYPPEAQVQFRQQLSELLYTRIPQAVRDQMTNLDRTTKSLLHSPLWVHALFAVRSDRMHLLNSLQEELPEILQNRYELKALSATQAEAAIVRPARLSNPSFLLKNPFEYEPVALKKILFELSKARETGQELEVQSPIEAFQLQIVCQTIEQNLIARTIQLHGAQPDLVTESDLPEFEQIYEQYYADKLTDLPADLDRRTAHILLEEELVIGEELADARRISMDKDLLKDTMLQNHHLVVSAELLAYLENKFLIRREIIGGRIHYEVIHDVLLPPILKSRDTTRQRVAEERAAALVKAQQMATERRVRKAEEQATLEQSRRMAAEKQRRRARILAGIAIFAFLFAAVMWLWASKQKKTAEVAQRSAEKQREAANEALKKVIDVRREKIMSQIKLDQAAGFKESAEANKLRLRRAEDLEKQNQPPDQILNELEK